MDINKKDMTKDTGCFCGKSGSMFDRKMVDGKTRAMTFSVKHDHRARVCHNRFDMDSGIRKDDAK